MERIDWVAWRGEDWEDMASVLEVEMGMVMALVREIEPVRQQSHASMKFKTTSSHDTVHRLLTFTTCSSLLYCA
jgi:hypothetical protein